MRLKLIIFDCDGILVDSEPISTRIFTNMLNEIKISITPQQTEHLFKGKSMVDCCRIVEQKFDKTITSQFLKNFRERTFSAFKEELKPIPGIRKVLKSLDFPRCVASSGPLNKIELNLQITNLRSYFKNNIFSATDLGKGKPAPDIFLYAAKKMQTRPENCVVIEDSLTGVKAGLAAKMQVFFFKNMEHRSVFSNSNQVKFFDKMTELPHLISNLNDKQSCERIK